jgi:hypothetical protein
MLRNVAVLEELKMELCKMSTGPKQSHSELFFSLPKDKMPFIGIIHSDLDAHRLRSEFLTEYEKKEIFISFNGDTAGIRAQLTNRDVVQFYSQLVYNRAEFLVWLDTVKDFEKINFGHLQKKDGKPEVVIHPKINQRFYFTIDRLFVLDFKDKAAVRIIR